MSLSPKEHAEKIAAQYWKSGWNTKDEFVSNIAAEIREAILEAKCTCQPAGACSPEHQKMYDEVYEAGRKAGFEDKSILEARLDTLTNQVNDMRNGTLGELKERIRNYALEQAAEICEGDILDDPNEFEGKTKLKVFDLVERIAAKIRALSKEPKSE